MDTNDTQQGQTSESQPEPEQRQQDECAPDDAEEPSGVLASPPPGFMWDMFLGALIEAILLLLGPLLMLVVGAVVSVLVRQSGLLSQAGSMAIFAAFCLVSGTWLLSNIWRR